MTIRREKRSENTFSTIQESRHAYRQFDDNVYSRLEFLKAVSHSMAAHSSDLHTDATDSDSDSPDYRQATADADAATGI